MAGYEEKLRQKDESNKRLDALISKLDKAQARRPDVQKKTLRGKQPIVARSKRGIWLLRYAPKPNPPLSIRVQTLSPLT